MKTQEDLNLYMLIVGNTFKGLSLEGPEQINSYPDYVPAADELALTFESALPLVRRLVVEEMIDDSILDSISTIDNILTKSSLGDDPVFWEDEGLIHDDRWSTIRQEAKRIIKILGPEIEKEPFNPDIS